MEGRVAAAFACATLLAVSATAALPPKAGLADAVGQRWEHALDRLPADASAGRAERYFRSVALLETGHAVAALEVLRALSAVNEPFAGPALERIVEYSFDRGRYAEVVALSEGSKARSLIDLDAFAYRVGQSYFMQGKHTEAAKWLAKVGDSQWSPYARMTQALILYHGGDIPKAIEKVGEAVDAVPFHPDRELRKMFVDRFRLLRGRMIHQVALSSAGMDPATREKLLKVAVSQLTLIRPESPHYAEALRTLGWCAAEGGDSARALAAFETASGVDPENTHEDQWAAGKVMERLGYFDEAADAYGKARRSALEWADAWELESATLEDRDPVLWATGWGALHDLTATLERRTDALTAEVNLTRGAAAVRARRLDAADGRLGATGRHIENLAQELGRMDKDLYHYLDVIPARALFPKRDRPRIDALMDRRERLLGQIVEIEKALQEVARTRSWTLAGPAMVKRADGLWERAHQAGAHLSGAQLSFLEGVKYRVSVREKELVRLVDARKQENTSLRDPQHDNTVILAEERARLAKLNQSIAVLAERAAKAAEAVVKVRADLQEGLKDAGKERLRSLARQLRLKADAYAVDEAQALHLLEQRIEREE